MLQLDLKTFFKTLSGMTFSFCRLFFLSFHAPSEFISLFYGTQQEGRRIEKSFGRQKCWGQRSRPALFFSVQRAKTELFRIHPPK